ncbi:MAG: ABC transporter substrate-binding protein [Desulfovibrio sp.]
MNVHTLTIVLILTVMAALPACMEESVVRIGFSGQLTGPSADMGTAARNGAILAVETINEAGGINGKKLELIVADDGNSVSSAIKADEKLIAQGACAIIGHLTSSITVGTIKHFGNKILYISPTTSTPILSGIKDSFFRIIPTNTNMATIQAQHASSVLDIQQMTILYDIDNAEYSETYAEAFKSQYERDGKKVHETFVFSSKDRNSWLPFTDRLKASNATGILMIAASKDAASFIQYLSQHGLDITVLVTHWSSPNEIIRRAGKAADGLVALSTHNPSDYTPQATRFKRRYKNRFGHSPIFSSYFSYEAVMLLVEAIKRNNGNTDNLETIIPNISSIEGISTRLSLDPYGDAIRNKQFIITVDNGTIHSEPFSGGKL